MGYLSSLEGIPETVPPPDLESLVLCQAHLRWVSCYGYYSWGKTFRKKYATVVEDCFLLGGDDGWWRMLKFLWEAQVRTLDSVRMESEKPVKLWKPGVVILVRGNSCNCHTLGPTKLARKWTRDWRCISYWILLILKMVTFQPTMLVYQRVPLFW